MKIERKEVSWTGEVRLLIWGQEVTLRNLELSEIDVASQKWAPDANCTKPQ
jgi:hypothetical protein